MTSCSRARALRCRWTSAPRGTLQAEATKRKIYGCCTSVLFTIMLNLRPAVAVCRFIEERWRINERQRSTFARFFIPFLICDLTLEEKLLERAVRLVMGSSFVRRCSIELLTSELGSFSTFHVYLSVQVIRTFRCIYYCVCSIQVQVYFM